MGLLSWIILGAILFGDMLVVIAAYNTDRAKHERKLSRYTLDGLINELNRNSHNPKIYWK